MNIKQTPLIRYTGLMTMPDGTQQSVHFYRVEAVEQMQNDVWMFLEQFNGSGFDGAAMQAKAQTLRGMLKGWTRCSISFEHPPHDFCGGNPGAVSPINKLIEQEKGRTT